ncbi:hypothetical protein D3C73_386700 [compost metagenome]
MLRDQDDPFEAPGHDPDEGSIEAEGHQQHRSKPGRHHQEADDRHGSQVRGKPIGGDAMEMLDGKHRRRKTTDQRCRDNAGDKAPAKGSPCHQRMTDGKSLPLFRFRASRPGRITGHERNRGSKRHLETWPQNFRRRPDEDDQRRQGYVSQTYRGPVQKHGNKYHRHHDIGALGGYTEARYQIIGRNHCKRPDSGNLLDWQGLCEAREKSKDATQSHEENPGGKRHIQSGNGNDVSEAGDP